MILPEARQSLIKFSTWQTYIQILSYASQDPAPGLKRVELSPVEIWRARGHSNRRRPCEDGQKCDRGVGFRIFHTFIMLSIIRNTLSSILLSDQTYYAPFMIRSDSLRLIKFLSSGIKSVVTMLPPIHCSSTRILKTIELSNF